jgi:hypothetical protein
MAMAVTEEEQEAQEGGGQEGEGHEGQGGQRAFTHPALSDILSLRAELHLSLGRCPLHRITIIDTLILNIHTNDAYYYDTRAPAPIISCTCL